VEVLQGIELRRTNRSSEFTYLFNAIYYAVSGLVIKFITPWISVIIFTMLLSFKIISL